MTLNELNNTLRKLPDNSFHVARNMIASVCKARGVDVNDPTADDVIAAERESVRELYAIKRAIEFLCANGAGNVQYYDAIMARVIPIGERGSHLPGQLILSADESIAQAVDWLLSFQPAAA